MDMATEYTVVFLGHPRNIKGNPFDVVSEFGKVSVMSVGNACATEDNFRSALEEIADHDGKLAEIAQAALDQADADLAAALKSAVAV
jgi:hypothetical protein